MGNTPNVRFKGFTEDWEQRKVCNITTSYSGGTPKSGSTEYYDGDIPFIRSGEIYSDKTELFITKLGMKNSSAKIVHKGDILYALYGATSGEVSRAKLDGAINQAILAIIPNDDINANFLVEWFRKEKDKITDTYLQGGQGNLSAQIIKELEVTIPSDDEQNKIGLYFEQLNTLITLHQQKCDETKEFKKYMLQNMFPQKDEKVPKIRFDGFTGDWEQRKVGDYYEFKNGLNKGKEFFGMGTPIVNFTDVFHKRGLLVSDLQGKVTLEQKEIDNFLVKKGDIFFTRTSETVEEIGYPSVMLESPENTVFSGFVLRGRTFLEQDPLEDVFKKYVFFTDSFRKEMMSKSSMTTRALTSGTAIKNMVFYHPLSKEEQKKIGDYFSKLDNLITLHQQKCAALKEFKKYMLQNMFPQKGENKCQN